MLCANYRLALSSFLPRADSGTFGVPGRVRPGRGTNGLDSGMSGAIRDRWQPYSQGTLQFISFTEKSHEIHMWILCVLPISHVHSACGRNVKR